MVRNVLSANIAVEVARMESDGEWKVLSEL